MSNAPWHPKRTLAEANDILCAPGRLHEMETCLIEGKVQRVYKNQWPSLRAFSLWCFNEYKDRPYVVFEKQRYTYQEVFDRVLKAASVYSDVYGVKKGDRVGICSRNHPEYIVAFWACHIIGAVPVLTNAWLPTDALHHCLAHTQCKLIMLDPERADRLEPVISKLSAAAGTAGVVVFESHEGKGNWNGMQSWDTVLRNYRGDPGKILQRDPEMVPEDNALIIFTSGTTGLPKGVLSTQRQFLTNTFNTLVGRWRALLRKGEDIPIPSPDDPQPGILISVPLFHATGTTSLLMTASFGGAKVVLMRKWVVEEGVRLIREEKIVTAGGVPSMSADLIESSLVGYPLDGLTFGGAPTADAITVRARAAFPTVTLSQAYGLTETNSIAVIFSGEDYHTRPSSCGLPTPVNDILIMKNDKEVRTGELGEVWLRGPNVMQEYWHDPAATAKALTKDGWLRTGDIGLVDQEGFLYIRDRIKDIIIRGGENIDSVSVENALFTDGVLEVAAVGVPDQRLGELVAGVVSIKPSYRGKVTEASLIALARQRLPAFAVPVMILFLDEIEHNPSGKIMKGNLRVLAGQEWEKRKTHSAKL